MKIFLYFILYFICAAASAQTTLTFTPLAGDHCDPNRGAQNWGQHPWDDIFQPTIPTGNSVAKNYYTRFNWRDIEPTTQGVYDWTIFDNYVNAAMAVGAQFTFGVMIYCDGCGTAGTLPAYVQTLMANEGKPGWSNGGFIVPNYQSVQLVNRYSALLRAIANHINTTSRAGVPFRKAFIGFDIRHFGNFGEGVGIANSAGTPATAQITDTYMNRMVDSAVAIFPNVQLTYPMSYSAPFGGSYGVTNGIASLASAYKILSTYNNYGKAVWRRDNLGDDGYNSALFDCTGSYNPGDSVHNFKYIIRNDWKYGPLGGEPALDNPGVSRCGQPYCDMANEDAMFHLSYFGNGNYPNTSGTNPTLWAQQIANMRAASAEEGYHIVLDSGKMTTSISSGNAFNIKLYVKNTGLAPVYETWRVTYELRNNVGGTVVWTGISRSTPKLLLPSSTETIWNDNFSMNNSIPSGTYSMFIKIIDTAGYKAPFPLSITGRTADGAYPIRTGITMTYNAATDSLTYIVVWGESNAAGNAPNTGAPANELGNRPEIKILNHPTGTFVTANISGNTQQDGFIDDGAHHGLVLGMANEVDSGRLPNPTYHLIIGVSGAPICQWIPTVGYGPNNGSNCRSGLIGLFEGWVMTYGDAGAAAMNALGRPYRTWVWGSEGLNDAYVYGTNIDSFTTKFRLFKTLFRARYSRPTMQFLVTNFDNPPALTALPPWLAVFRDSLKSGDIYSHAIPVNTATYMDGGSHYDYLGFKLIAKNMVDTMLNIQGFSTSNPIPHAPPTAVINPSTATLTLPTSSIALSGTSSFAAAPASIVAYAWSKISGPGTPTITAPTASTTSINGFTAGAYVYQLQVTDDSSSIGTTTITITVSPAPGIGGSVFTTETPAGSTLNDVGSGTSIVGIELGMKFRSSTAGLVTGVRFYKTTGNTGTHIGELYTNAGVRLAQATFTGETASGWQFVTFSSPVAITANTTYIVAYFSSLGNYTATSNFFNTATVNSPLTGLADGTDGNNGLFKYTATPAVPNTAFQKSNYWVDVLFSVQSHPNIVQCTGSGACVLNMIGVGIGDTIRVATQTGTYTSLAAKDLHDVVVRPQSGRPIFTTQSTFCRLVRVDISGFSFVTVASNPTAIDATCGRIDSSQFSNMYFQGWTGPVWSASGNYPYTYGNDTTYKWLRDKFDSIKFYQTGKPYQGAFGVNPITTDIMRRDTFSRHVIEATTSTSNEGIWFSGVCYGCLWENNKSTSITGRGASGDDGGINGAGWWTVRNSYQSGSPNYFMRLFPMMELNDTGTTKFYNNAKLNGTQYGMVNMQVNFGDTIANQRRGNGAQFYNNTMGNQFNDTLGYWSTMFNLGQVSPNCHYYVVNNFGFNIGNNPQRAAAGGQPNNGKPFIAGNLGGWNTIGGDTSHNQYWPYATTAKLDSTTTLFSNSLGSFKAYYLTSTSPGILLQGGLTNPLTSTDFSGAAYRVPPDLGYLQFNGAVIVPPSVVPGLHRGWRKKVYQR